MMLQQDCQSDVKHETIGIRVYRGGKALYRASWLRASTDITIVHFPLIYSEIRRVREKKQLGLNGFRKFLESGIVM